MLGDVHCRKSSTVRSIGGVDWLYNNSSSISSIIMMARPRRSSTASDATSIPERQQVINTCKMLEHHVLTVEQELGSMYDYLAKIILLGPSGAGKSVLILVATPAAVVG